MGKISQFLAMTKYNKAWTMQMCNFLQLMGSLVMQVWVIDEASKEQMWPLLPEENTDVSLAKYVITGCTFDTQPSATA